MMENPEAAIDYMSRNERIHTKYAKKTLLEHKLWYNSLQDSYSVSYTCGISEMYSDWERSDLFSYRKRSGFYAGCHKEVCGA